MLAASIIDKMVFYFKKSIIMKRHTKSIGKSQSGQIDFELLNST